MPPKRGWKRTRARKLAAQQKVLETLLIGENPANPDGKGNPQNSQLVVHEGGKGIVSLTPAIQGQRGARFEKEVATLFQYEEPDINLVTLEKMYKRLSIAQRAIQVITFHTMQGGVGVKPPQHLLDADPDLVKVPDRLTDNMLFIRKWKRFIGFNETMVKVVLYWIIKGNAYLEIVYDEHNPWHVTELKPIPADQMRVIRDPTGEVLGYLQFPPNISPQFYTYNRQRAEEVVGAHGAIYFRPGEIIHLKFMPLESAPYGRSLLEAAKDPLAIQTGMLEDIGIILRNYAAPLLFFQVGTEQVPANAETINAMATIITAQLAASSNIVTSSAVQGSVLAPGKGTMSLEDYYSQAVKGVIMALGVPPLLMGYEDISEAAGRQQLEAFSRFIRVLRGQLDHMIEMRLFPLLLDGIPINSDGIPVVMPEHLDWIPEVLWEPIETEEERRIRDQNDFRFGATTREEYRVGQGKVPQPAGQLVLEQDLDAQMTLASMKSVMMGDRTDTGATPKGKPTVKKSDRDEEFEKAKGKAPDATRKDKKGRS